MLVKSPCAGCGTEIERYTGLQSLAEEFCGPCNGRYAESLRNVASPVTIAILEALSYRTHISHATGHAGDADEECCGACYVYRRWLGRERDWQGQLPENTGGIHARTLRAYLENVDAGTETATDAPMLAEMRRELRRIGQ